MSDTEATVPRSELWQDDSAAIPRERSLVIAWWIAIIAAVFFVLAAVLLIPDPYREIIQFIGDGLVVTFQITIVSMTLALVLGLFAGLGRTSRITAINTISSLYVEVIRGITTDDSVTQRTIDLSKKMGKAPHPANDRAGFVSNRILMPMINEAFYTWMEGVAEPEHIDEIMKLGMNHPMGPLQLADFIGLDTCAHIMHVLADGLHSERYRPCPLLEQLVTAGRLGNKSGHGVYTY